MERRAPLRTPPAVRIDHYCMRQASRIPCLLGEQPSCLLTADPVHIDRHGAQPACGHPFDPGDPYMIRHRHIRKDGEVAKFDKTGRAPVRAEQDDGPAISCCRGSDRGRRADEGDQRKQDDGQEPHVAIITAKTATTNGSAMTALLLFLFAAAAPDATASPPASTTSQPTAQQQFDAASTAARNGDCTNAVKQFEALEARAILKAGSIPDAATAVRKGRCLVRIGRISEGEAALRRGRPVLEKAGPEFAIDLVEADIALGDAASTYYDDEAALAHYRRGLAASEGVLKLTLLGRLTHTTMFMGDETPLRYADQGIAILKADPKPDKTSLASFHTLHARALLNQGRAQEGYDELKKALSLSGGLTTRTSLNQAALRGDLAMAAALSGHRSDASLYIAYTGAGRTDARFAPGRMMDAPPCGTETGLRPEDVAVVEMGIGEDGAVRRADTIYTRGGPAVAKAFAQSVRNWYWAPETVAKIPPFYRLFTRVEMRCSLAGGQQPGLSSPALARMRDWAIRQLPEMQVDGTSASQMTQLRQLHTDGKLASDARADAAALSLLAVFEPASDATQAETTDQAIAKGRAAGVPAEVINFLRIHRITAPLSRTTARREDRLALVALAQEPDFAKDALAVDTVLMLAADADRGSSLREAPTYIKQVADDARLPDKHPLRQAARLMLANKAASAGDLATAQDYFVSTGLTEQQCALIGVKPALKSSGADSNDYPEEALQMGFNGWVLLEYDISPDGRAVGTRPVVAYPPLIFVDAASKMSKDFRYTSSYRPAGSPACSANQQTINFIM